MAVQIYQNEELNDIMFQIEALDEWKQLADELGMESQLEFVRKAESPIPYPHINKSMELIFRTLCPAITDFKTYSKTTIPLEVMKQIGYSVKEKHFTKIEIWYDDRSPDPFAIGYVQKWSTYDKKYNRLKDTSNKDMLFDSSAQAKNYAETIFFDYYGTTESICDKYLIARWADELRPIPELKELAKQRLLEKYGAELRIEIEERTQALKKLTDSVILYLNAEITEGQLKGSKW
jgi:hypothetical protein